MPRSPSRPCRVLDEVLGDETERGAVSQTPVAAGVDCADTHRL
ncbi:hypothetical protein [Geodermatophilus normandii]|nr:hypothetical protein [Geodermatophilus normandii]